MNLRLIEEMVPNPPDDMKGWRFFRIEYGHAGREVHVWLPPATTLETLEILEAILNGAEVEDGCDHFWPASREANDG